MEKDLKKNSTKNVNIKTNANTARTLEIFKSYMENSIERVYFFDDELKIILANRAVFNFFNNHNEKTMYGQTLADLFPEIRGSGILDALNHTQETGLVSRGTWDYRITNVEYTVFKLSVGVGLVIKDTTDLRAYEKRLEALHVSANKIANANNINEINSIIIEIVTQVFGYINASFGYIEENYFVFAESIGYEIPENTKISLDASSIIIRSIKTKKTQLVHDVTKDPDFYSVLTKEASTFNSVHDNNDVTFYSELAVPIVIADEAVGAINIEDLRINVFTQEDVQLVETLAQHVASAINRFRKEEKEEIFKKRLTALHTSSLLLGNTFSIADVAVICIDTINRVLGFEFGQIGFIENNYYVNYETSNIGGHRFKISLDEKSIIIRAIKTKRTQVVNDISQDPDYVWAADDVIYDSKSEFVVPLVIEDTCIGVINIESNVIDAFSDEEVQLIETLANHVSSAMMRLKAAEDREKVLQELALERVRVEQADELSRLKNQFISTATHELRTPVTSILGFLELVLGDPSRDIPVNVREDLNVVFRNANRLVTLTNDLLDVQRITSGRFEIQREQVDLVKTLNEVVEELTPLFDEKQQELLVEAPSELIVNVDAMRISQLFINLLRNANKFTPEEGNITATVEPFETHVQVSVRDSGIGLSDEDIGKLFKPFPGIHHGLNVSSTGLGLSIVKGIVELHGGEIWAESGGLGKGSTFSFTIPIEQ